ncbi:hypothetical protein [Streptomyces sp. ISL-94]|uniref:hypothetical protein n=1 Tax=Streptomyces sp. ISL-94 TaxID=2819190 RepID=UPI001BE8A8DD|nr:hypothetical protein [Streptomyces sp. ISL-94]MBT2482993.1 hypothetical protein [Streptomyces sp. ISL-94]
MQEVSSKKGGIDMAIGEEISPEEKREIERCIKILYDDAERRDRVARELVARERDLEARERKLEARERKLEARELVVRERDLEARSDRITFPRLKNPPPLNRHEVTNHHQPSGPHYPTALRRPSGIEQLQDDLRRVNHPGYRLRDESGW